MEKTCKYAIPGKEYRNNYEFSYKCAVMYECIFENPTEEKAIKRCPRYEIGQQRMKRRGETEL